MLVRLRRYCVTLAASFLTGYLNLVGEAMMVFCVNKQKAVTRGLVVMAILRHLCVKRSASGEANSPTSRRKSSQAESGGRSRTEVIYGRGLQGQWDSVTLCCQEHSERVVTVQL